MYKTALVVASNRPECFARFAAAWQGAGGWDRLILVEDGPTKTFPPVGQTDHYAWDDVERIVGPVHGIFSRRDSAIKAFGFMAAYWLGADMILTLDDDCYPHPGQTALVAGHRAAMVHPVWVESVPGRRTRGLPYRNRGRLPDVVANVGLWSGVADDDAACALVNDPGPFTPPAGTVVVPHGQFVPVCGMNLAFARKAAPLFYFPKMGAGSPYRRFDDIWGGIIAKRVMDHLGWRMSVGEPFIVHARASDPFKNLVAEAPGVGLNETFWEAVAAAPLTATHPVAAVAELGVRLAESSEPYTASVGAALQTWTDLFMNRPEGL
jgi:hypothetical protein